MKLSSRTIVAIGIGAAVFLVLNRFVSIPSGIPNTTINTAYAFLAFMAVIFGPIAGALIGLIGHVLTDATAYGSVWWSWVIVSVFVGAVIGLPGRELYRKWHFWEEEIITSIFTKLRQISSDGAYLLLFSISSSMQNLRIKSLCRVWLQVLPT
jgi:energy-coupling factor transport system substrate-specific component